MPVHSYHCLGCGEVRDYLHPIDSNPLSCDACGADSSNLVKHLSAPNIGKSGSTESNSSCGSRSHVGDTGHVTTNGKMRGRGKVVKELRVDICSKLQVVSQTIQVDGESSPVGNVYSIEKKR